MKIEFIDNYYEYSAFSNGYESRFEISRILKEIAGKIEDGVRSGVCMDINGNKIGTWEV